MQPDGAFFGGHFMHIILFSFNDNDAATPIIIHIQPWLVWNNKLVGVERHVRRERKVSVFGEFSMAGENQAGYCCLKSCFTVIELNLMDCLTFMNERAGLWMSMNEVDGENLN